MTLALSFSLVHSHPSFSPQPPPLPPPVEIARGPVVIFNMICYLYLLLHLAVIDGLPIVRAKLRSSLQIVRASPAHASLVHNRTRAVLLCFLRLLQHAQDSLEQRTTLFRDCSLSLGTPPPSRPL